MSVELIDDTTPDPSTRSSRAKTVFLAEHVKLAFLLFDLRAGLRRRDPWQIGIALADIVISAADTDRAIEVLTAIATRHTEDWVCPHCDELQPKTFDYCWNCDTLHPELAGESSAPVLDLCASA